MKNTDNDIAQTVVEHEEVQSIEVAAPGWKFKLSGNEGWNTIFKAIVLILTTAAGLKIIWHYL